VLHWPHVGPVNPNEQLHVPAAQVPCPLHGSGTQGSVTTTQLG